jgi:hypothetical protein
MAYARFGEDSDVYVYHDIDDLLHCLRCPLAPPFDFTATTGAEMLAHLAGHRAAGHAVPDGVEGEIERDWPAAGAPPS